MMESSAWDPGDIMIHVRVFMLTYRSAEVKRIFSRKMTATLRSPDESP